MHLVVGKLALVLVAALEGQLAAAVHQARAVLARVAEHRPGIGPLPMLQIGLR